MAKIINDPAELQNLFDDINNNVEIECKFSTDADVAFNMYGYENAMAYFGQFIKYPSIYMALDISDFNNIRKTDFFQKHRFVKINNKRVYLKGKIFFIKINFIKKIRIGFSDEYIFKVTDIHL